MRLDDVVDPVAEWVNAAPQGRPLFSTEQLLLPSNGVKAWLLPELARRVGARPGKEDGVVANVQVGYLGSLTKFIVPHRHRDIDPWSVESMTAVLLGLIVGDASLSSFVQRAGGELRAAARLAERFDRYHARRPMMIRAWDKGSPVMSPTTADSFNDGEWRPADLGDQRWQFDLWCRMRDIIGVAPWPVQIEAAVQQLRRGENIVGVPGRLMVAGMQSLSLSAVELLDAFGHVSDVEVLLVHPSPALAQSHLAFTSSLAVRRGALQLRPADEDLPTDVHPMVHSWLRGARELQELLASQGLEAGAHEPHGAVVTPSLLGRVRTAIETGGLGERVPRADDDLSIQVHRCYNLTRQVEVLHDALLHAFRDIDGLAPHEVLIVSPRLVEAAPVLEAVFDRTVSVETADGRTEVRIPLAVAERELRSVDPAVEFLASLLELMTGRFDVSAFLAVAASPLVARHLGIDVETIAVWQRQIARTRVYWGLSAEQRTAAGLAPEAASAHTWKSAVERALLGAALPDTLPAIELGDVVPLADVGADDIDALSRLVQVFDAIEALESAIRIDPRREIVEWCDALEATVIALCGTDDKVSKAFEMIEALAATTILRRPDGTSTAVGAAVPFSQVAAHLLAGVSGVPGHQPLRTGAVTATSLMPLRGVPYRVVCLLGIDDGVFGGGEVESDDLAGRQVFIGDDDPRIDARRQFLDAVLAANERVIITCDGRSIQNNATIPLTTALAEFVDFTRRHGAGERGDGEGSDIEFLHPRHATSLRNFFPGGVVPGRIWSHSTSVRDVAGKVGAVAAPKTADVTVVQAGTANVVDLESLVKLVQSPLEMFVNDVLDISTWVEDAGIDQAVIPLGVDRITKRNFIDGYLVGRCTAGSSFDPNVHRDLARLNGDIPVGAYGEAVVAELQTLAESLVAVATTYALDPVPADATPILVALSAGSVLKGSIPHLQTAGQLIGVVKGSKSYDRDHLKLGVRLLAAAAAGLGVRHGITVHEHKDKEKAGQAIARLVYLGDTIDTAEATRRLDELVQLHAAACAMPMPTFGGTVKAIFADPDNPNIEAGREKFNSFVRSADYATSLERRIHGAAPDFDVIFAPHGPVVSFWDRFHGVFHFTKRKAENLPGKMPHGGSHWGIL
jgi:exodeoxyribonuclease V gamma subunit